jgi:hypothetical protein
MPIKLTATKKSLCRSVQTPAIKKRLFYKKDLFKIAGCLSSQDSAELKAIIEQGCEFAHTRLVELPI